MDNQSFEPVRLIYRLKDSVKAIIWLLKGRNAQGLFTSMKDFSGFSI